jgi:hypothetical protein
MELLVASEGLEKAGRRVLPPSTSRAHSGRMKDFV